MYFPKPSRSKLPVEVTGGRRIVKCGHKNVFSIASFVYLHDRCINSTLVRHSFGSYSLDAARLSYNVVDIA